jgi:predicted O-methyltransferase YrrM
MSHIFQNIKEKSIFQYKASHHNGFGIHSPYLFHLISGVLEETCPYYCFNQIESTRPLLKKELKTFHKNNKTDVFCGQILFRLIQDAQSRILFEIGTSAGLETQYMAFSSQKAKCISVTDSVELAEVLQKDNGKKGLKNIELKIPTCGETLESRINQLESIDFVYFNESVGNLKMIDLFNQCLLKKKNGSIFVLNKIHVDSEKKKVWEKIQMYPDVRVTLDLYDLGIVLFNPNLEKNNYVIRL